MNESITKNFKEKQYLSNQSFNFNKTITENEILDFISKSFTLDDVPEDKLYSFEDYIEDTSPLIQNDEDLKNVFLEYCNSSAYINKDNLLFEIFGEKNIKQFCYNTLSIIKILQKAYSIKTNNVDENIKIDKVVIGCHNRSVQDSYASHIKWLYKCLNHFNISYSAEGLQEIMEIHNFGTNDKSLGKADYSSYQNNSIDAITSQYKNSYNSVTVNSDRWNTQKTLQHKLSFDKIGKDSFASQSNLVVSNMDRLGEYTIYFYGDSNQLVETNFTNKHYDRQARCAQVVLFKQNGQFFQLVNLHGSWSPKKEGEIDIAKNMISMLKNRFENCEIPTLIMGDFNIKRNTEFARSINKVFTNINDLSASVAFEKEYGKIPSEKQLINYELLKYSTTKMKNNNGDWQNNYILDYIFSNKKFDEIFNLSFNSIKNNESFFDINKENSISDHKELTFSFLTKQNLITERFFERWADALGNQLGTDVQTLRDFIVLNKFYKDVKPKDINFERDVNYSKYLFLKDNFSKLFNNTIKLSKQSDLLNPENLFGFKKVYNDMSKNLLELHQNYPDEYLKIITFFDDVNKLQKSLLNNSIYLHQNYENKYQPENY